MKPPPKLLWHGLNWKLKKKKLSDEKSHDACIHIHYLMSTRSSEKVLEHREPLLANTQTAKLTKWTSNTKCQCTKESHFKVRAAKMPEPMTQTDHFRSVVEPLTIESWKGKLARTQKIRPTNPKNNRNDKIITSIPEPLDKQTRTHFFQVPWNVYQDRPLIVWTIK